VCPLLGLVGDRRSVVDGIDTAHRCHADAEPLPIERGWQAKFCLTASHPQCERYQQAMARRGTAVSGRTPIGDGLVSTRMVLAPEPAWRGMAGRARRAGPRRLVAAGAVVAVVGATALTALVIADASERAAGLPDPSPSESTSPAPTRTPRPTASATPSPTPTPAPTPVPPPVETPTPVPAATPRTYVVQQGDTLAAIAQQFGTTTEAIQAANGITNPNSITVGQVLTIP
jgi:LysM repeat protein